MADAGAGASLGGGIGGAIGGAIGLALAGRGGKRELQAARAIWEKLQVSNFDFSQLQPYELKVVAEQMPQIFEAYAPPEIQAMVANPQYTEVQNQAIGQLQGAANQGGLTAAEQFAAEGIQDQTSRSLRDANQAVTRDLAERGMGGGGLEASLRLQANASEAQAGSDASRSLQAEAVNQRRNAMLQSAGLAGQVQGQAIDLQRMNADLQSRHNELVAGLQSRAREYAAGARERTQAANVGTRQRTAEENQRAAYDTRTANLERKNRLKQLQFGQNLAKTEGLSNAYTKEGLMNEERRRNQIAGAAQIGTGLGSAAGSLGGGYLL